MLGTRRQFARRTNGDDRFENAEVARRWRISGGGGSTGGADAASTIDLSGSSNLGRFLQNTTPVVSARKTRMGGWSNSNTEYFTLGDLWESFKEWSAYGAGVPLVLNGGDCVVQYYVPYLSGIQLYGESSRHADNYRQSEEDSDIDSFRDSSSDGSCDYDMDFSQNHLANGFTAGIDRHSVRDNHVIMQEGFSSDDSDIANPQGRLLFQYLEQDPPYCREPLVDKVIVLANQFPELWTLKSSDLLPKSWISVAWYPIYRIPTGPTLKDLDACFLTFHSLSTPMKGAHPASGPTIEYSHGINGIPKISLPCFGLASYKFQGPLWTPSERRLATSLRQAADDWLQLLSVYHPDFRFFTTHGAFFR